MSSKPLSLNNPENFKILLATDIHLGFEEKNLVRGENKFYCKAYDLIISVIQLIT